MKIKAFLLKIYYFSSLDKEKIEFNQEKIRGSEWEAVLPFIPSGCKFLDIGCGTGYAMRRAKELNCDVYGIDPEPGAHGVGRYSDLLNDNLNIQQGFSENLPYEDNSFDVVYCSHVLEHVKDENKSLNEMRRVLKSDGILIIGMPTASMAWINLLTNLLFTSHQRIVNGLLGPLKIVKAGHTPLINIILPPSHSSHRAKTVLFDIRYYRVSNWRKIIQPVFKVKEKLLPAIYPYPEFLQFFKLKRNRRISSSVFFICEGRK